MPKSPSSNPMSFKDYLFGTLLHPQKLQKIKPIDVLWIDFVATAVYQNVFFNFNR